MATSYKASLVGKGIGTDGCRNQTEYMYHPINYKTSRCWAGVGCPDWCCSMFHDSAEELEWQTLRNAIQIASKAADKFSPGQGQKDSKIEVNKPAQSTEVYLCSRHAEQIANEAKYDCWSESRDKEAASNRIVRLGGMSADRHMAERARYRVPPLSVRSSSMVVRIKNYPCRPNTTKNN